MRAVGGIMRYGTLSRPRIGRSHNGLPSFLLSSKRSLAQIPVFSRGLPFASSQGGQFGGVNAEANAIDADYGTTWDSVFQPSTDGAQWYALDLRGISAATKKNVLFFWKNRSGFYYDATSPLGPLAGSNFIHLPTDYKIQGHASAGALPAVGDAGWTDIVVVANNRYNARMHTGLDLSNFNWIRLYCTRTSGAPGATESLQMEIDLRDMSGGIDDSFFGFGDSITQAALFAQRPGNQPWINGPLENVLQNATGRIAPIVIDAGVIGWHASDANSQKVPYIGSTPCKYVMLNFGSNDANNAGSDLNLSGGINSAFAQTWKTDMQAAISYAVGLGRKVIIPTIPWGAANAFTDANLQILNTIIGQLVAENPGNVFLGPDFYSFFKAHPNCLQGDNLHPTYDPTDNTGKYNGLTGYENWIKLWADWIIANLY